MTQPAAAGAPAGDAARTLDVAGLHSFYGPSHILQGVDLHVGEGELVALLGRKQQMLAIGRALTGDPRLLLVDEPTQGLAPLLARAIAEVLVQIRERGVSILLVEQNALLALELADRAYVIDRGMIRFAGTAA